ncbi:HDOD domain-containing protein [Congregibacter sp.]|uniref:HDOD domain-containing protein n=1 Tax=Congregibacter sp. TaxID=2744308 RepID=UPI00385D1E9B
MGFDALWMVLIGVVAAVIWLLLRKPKNKARPSRRAEKPVSRPSTKGAESAELPVFEPAGPTIADAPERALPEELKSFHLIMQAELSSEVLAGIESICERMPEPHPVQRQLASGLDTPDDLMDAVASDAGLTASILRTVNSAAFSLASPITSVQHAITYLGVSVVKGLVAQAAVAEQLDEGDPAQQAALLRIWKSACTASALAQMLAQELGLERPSVLATKALFFNLGDVALVTCLEGLPESYIEGVSIVERVTAQQNACSANTAIVGAALARLWRLPEDIAEAIDSGFIPLVTPASAHPMQGVKQQENVIMYLAGRIGDRVTYRGLRDIAELNVTDSDEPGLFYLADHLESAGLGRVPALLQEPAFRRKVNRVLAALNA